MDDTRETEAQDLLPGDIVKLYALSARPLLIKDVELLVRVTLAGGETTILPAEGRVLRSRHSGERVA